MSHAPQPPWESHHFLAAARSLGQFNAHWPAHALPSWEWLNRSGVRAGFTGNPGYQASFAQLATGQGHPLLQVYAPTAQANLLPHLWDKCDRLLQQVEATPKGVCHLDCHPKNLFQIHNGNGAVRTAYTVAIDWVKVGIADLGIDIGHLLASPITWLEVTLDEAVLLRDAIFDTYVVGLADEGWSGNVAEVRITYLTRLACEANRNANLMTRSVNSPTWLTMMERFMGHPIEEIAMNYRDALSFYHSCKDEALRLALA